MCRAISPSSDSPLQPPHLGVKAKRKKKEKQRENKRR
jgi:hypothetical protein